MNILLLGATGRVGSELLQRALDDGHEVVALVRSQAKLNAASPHLYTIQGDVLQSADLERAMRAIPVDSVVSALGTDKNNTLSRVTPSLISLMDKHAVRRIITVGTAGILNSRNDPGLYRFQANESKRKTTTAAEDHLAAYRHVKASDLDWTIVCPTYLPAGDEYGNYRVRKNWLPEDGQKITVPDAAAFVYSQIASSEYSQSRAGIAY
ncbi:SDR family oxidoreductase [Barrientosiimonas marina]|uniref:NAD(P)-dependent oxidoreductase n=1 Tax=Lentibacillus kimchii TaxID=1542911 RepID=A0ABW2UTE7_9BACI